MRWVLVTLAMGCGLPQPDVVFPVSNNPTPTLCKNISSSCAQFLDPVGACFQPKGSCMTQVTTSSEGDPERDYCWSNGAKYSVIGVTGSDYSVSGSTCLVLEAGNPATLIASGELLEYDAKTRTLHCPDGTTADLSQCDNFGKLINPDVSKCVDGACD